MVEWYAVLDDDAAQDIGKPCSSKQLTTTLFEICRAAQPPQRAVRLEKFVVAIACLLSAFKLSPFSAGRG
ncbi:hypothetical protein ETAA8_21840 [Anatilimnocola aggregata]|uniref:Uncharacterized protein n=1 Tax=Anatilimnocola aggregata TaxID=2528021 RepID=A0A517YA39_9BACT|nr:hypothetical protein ETAA8_21840 [Anatilimnocola aggregata]